MDHTFKRKRNRMKNFDYSSSGSYFITLCCHERKPLLWADAGQKFETAEEIVLSPAGEIAQQAIREIPQHYTGVTIDTYCIMPEHIHILMFIETDSNGVTTSAPEISVIISQMKRQVSRQLGESIWQRSFFDRVIRSAREYNLVWQYINQNPYRMDHGDDKAILDLFDEPNA